MVFVISEYSSTLTGCNVMSWEKRAGSKRGMMTHMVSLPSPFVSRTQSITTVLDEVTSWRVFPDLLVERIAQRVGYDETLHLRPPGFSHSLRTNVVSRDFNVY